jgi:two-component system cell cycle response regulator DivK
VNNTAVSGPLVLVVDDNASNLRLAVDVLTAAGFRTLGAASGGDAFELAEAHVPDVILMDLRLPDMDGDEATRRLAAGPRTSAIPVVALSSLTLEDAWCRETGFAGHLQKPIDVEAFPAEVRRYCTG